MPKKMILQRMLHSKFFMIGFVLAILILLVALIGPQFVAYDPIETSLSERLQPPEWFKNGFSGHVLGTDQLGRDVLTRLITGARYSLMIAFATVLLQTVIGTALGLISGYVGGFLDTVIMRISDVILAVPNIILAIAVISVLGTSTFNLIIVLVLAGWVRECKVTRNNVMVVKRQEFVLASKALGAKSPKIVLGEIFPNITTPLIIMVSTRVGNVILVEANLSFLNLGIPAPTPSWGNMIADGRSYLATCPWLVFAPGIALMITILAFNFLGDGLRDVLDPKRI